MALGLRLDLKQSQQLVMTPQLQQAIRLLAMSNLELREFVEQEVEANPLLRTDEPAEAGAEGPRRDAAEAPLDARVTAEGDHGLAAETFDNGTENLYDAGPEYERGGSGWTGIGAGPGFDEGPDGPGPLDAAPVTLRAHLLAQLGQRRAAAHELAVARLMVEELDEHGYLRGDLAALGERIGAGPGPMAAGLALLQGCEPTGVGARDLGECLALQLAERDRLDPAMRALVDHLDLVAHGDLRRLRALCGVDEEDFADMLAELRALDPRPCAAFAAERAETLVPDVLLRRAPWGGWDIELNPETLPRVLVDSRYAARLGPGGGDAREFIADCRARATWLTRSLDQRARTILKVAAEIVRRQDGFFAEGVAGLRPLTLRMVAEATGLHESTASRVTSNKYIATERGIFELKFFFTNAIGEDGLTAEAVRQRIRSVVDGEVADGILSDDAIVEKLQALGIEIARRTVVKYRKQLRIPSSVERRRLKALTARE